MKKNNYIFIEEKYFQAAGFPSVTLFFIPDSSIYNQGITYDSNTNDTNDEIILNDILKKYSGAWEKLADF